MIDRIITIFHNRNMTIKTFLFLMRFTLYWRHLFLYIKVSVSTMNPITLMTLRIETAALILFVILKVQRKKLLEWIFLRKQFLFIVFISTALPFFLMSYGELSILSSVPLFTPLFMCIPELIDNQFTLELGIILTLIASISYTRGMVYAKKPNLRVPDLIILTWQLILSTLLLCSFSPLFPIIMIELGVVSLHKRVLRNSYLRTLLNLSRLFITHPTYKIRRRNVS